MNFVGDPCEACFARIMLVQISLSLLIRHCML